MSALKYLSCLFILVLIGCTKQESKESPTQLQLKVTDKNGDVISGATIYLYNTESDWANSINYVYSFYTDSKGEALLTNLDAKRYYIRVVYNCLKNRIITNIDYMVVVAPNTVTSKNIQLYSEGLIYFYNNFTNVPVLFSIYKDKKAIRSFQVVPMARGQEYFEDGFYDITAKLPSGDSYNWGNIYLNCGAILTIRVP